ncbi:conserved hypothetical protein [Prochlorococcus marinus str. MIT 9211]|uniref:Uncharacterized protein n=1 Tax=Prochlorococcus marinus (strain MIT 9211) TaxID=93059 RepID=A9BEG4_PROM4|nr:conserved hypothetical protein [Prochlorococcus marinus str. MIT 9211]
MSKKLKTQRVDYATLASSLQLEEESREFIYSLIAALMKLGLLSIGIASLLNLGFASHQRIRRNMELTSLVRSETLKYKKLHLRFDSLFTIGGRNRFIEEQGQWIMPNSIRVIWR